MTAVSIERENFPHIGEELFRAALPNGLDIFVIRKPDFNKNFAFFATNYGSVDSTFTKDGQKIETPDGVAHFLEHKMFDMKDYNALQEFVRMGASPNAFTSSSMTAYHFECTDNFEKNLEILLDFVSTPYFMQDSVDKEQGIIGQEIRMSEDSPGWMAYNNMLMAMYENHPVRRSIIGTIESIAKIDSNMLYSCHKVFYTPSNMTLCVAGNVDPDIVVETASRMLSGVKEAPIGRHYGVEDHRSAFCHRIECPMEVSMPVMLLGFKDEPTGSGQAFLRRELLSDLAVEALCGPSSPLYSRLYASGLINRGFNTGYNSFSGGGCMILTGDSPDPDRVREEVLKEAGRVASEGFDRAMFSRIKNAAYGARLRALDSLDDLCHMLTEYHFHGARFLDFPSVYEGLDERAAADYIRETITFERSALSVIRPVGA